MITNEVKNDIEAFLAENWDSFTSDAKEYGGLEITFATNDGEQWNYQTGDNSYIGGCYSLQHWAVEAITEDSSLSDIASSVLVQLNELLES